MPDSLKYTENKIFTTTAGIEPVEALLMQLDIDGVAVADSADFRAILKNKDKLDWDYVDPALFQSDMPIRGDGAVDLSREAAIRLAEAGGFPGEEAILTFYIPDDAEGAKLLSEIRTCLLKLKSDEQYGLFGADADFGRLYLESNPLSDDWKDKWKEGFKPFRITERFAVRPPWAEYDGEGEAIVIDPGMAFGTGSHETTSMCAVAIERFFTPGAVFLDVGTGSGILAILAAKLGAGKTVAVEIDEDAAASARLNFERNEVDALIELLTCDIREAEILTGIQFDIITANLTSGLLKLILPQIRRLFADEASDADRMDGIGGTGDPDIAVRPRKLILSGLLAAEESEMIKVVQAEGFTGITTEKKGEWLLLCADCC
ncbi:MAG: 50S ribosomal protein L11 methyltransferase [Clostridiales Family XIII bacterium]|jgi:ribosomal protein L11 methyltransferase|nr:50S ribosomal protein L11 methyltransferase [Clostridiales Family XIII bacterium]